MLSPTQRRSALLADIADIDVADSISRLRDQIDDEIILDGSVHLARLVHS